MILNNQQAIFDKAGLGYRSYSKQKSTCNLYKKSSKENLTCFCCGKIGHKAYAFKSRMLNAKSMKKVWVPKGTHVTNLQGPKKAWVTKTVT